MATNEYDYINNMLKQDLPRFMQLASQFIDPLSHSFYYMQCVRFLIVYNIHQIKLYSTRLNIYYLFLEKMNSFAEGKYNVTNVPGVQIQSDYENTRTDAWSQIEDLGITKRIVSTCTWIIPHRVFFIHRLAD